MFELFLILKSSKIHSNMYIKQHLLILFCTLMGNLVIDNGKITNKVVNAKW